MGTGQTMFAIGAMALLSTSTLSLFRGYNAGYQATMQAKLGITAVALGSSIIEQACSRYFDENSITKDDTSVSQLTTPSKLGAESGEYYNSIETNYDDFDDFNSLQNYKESFQDTVFCKPYGGGTFYISCAVAYVNGTNPNVAVTSNATWHKKLTVTITSPNMNDTVRMSCIFSYWYFMN